MRVRKRLETTSTRNGTGPATGPVIQRRPVGPAGEHRRPRRGDVEHEPGVERHGAPAAAQAHPQPVDALRRGRARLRAPVPAHAHRAPALRRARPTASCRTSVPASSTTETVTSSSLRTRMRKRATSRRPSPFGEKCWVTLLDRRDRRRALEPLCREERRERRRTSSTNTTRAKRLTGGAREPGRRRRAPPRPRRARGPAPRRPAARTVSIDSRSATVFAVGRKPSAK